MYKVRVKVEVVEVSGDDSAVLSDDGVLAFSQKHLTDAEGESIDAVEQAILAVGHDAIRSEISRHFSELSKKKPSKS